MAAPYRIFGRAFARNYSAQVQHHSDDSVKLWRNLFIFVGVPSISVSLVNSYLRHHEEESHPLTKWIAYPHLRLMNKPFPFGDGQRSLLFNPHAYAPDED